MQAVDRLVLQAKNILSQNQSCPVEVGVIDKDGFLHNVTLNAHLHIEVIQGKADIFTESGTLYLRPYSLKTLILKLRFVEIVDVITNYISLWVIPQAVYPQVSDLANAIYKYLYPNCYTQSQQSVVYSKNYASGRVISDAYNVLRQGFLTIYPPFTSDFAWEQQLNNNYPWQNSAHYNLVIQEVNNLSIQSANVYNTTLLISEYIYARLGLNLFVYVEETFSNPDNSWILGYSHLGSNTILVAPPDSENTLIVHIEVASLPAQFLIELDIFVEKIIPANANATIELNPDFSIFGLIINVADVYPEDPRLYVNYALRYNPDTVYNAEGLISPYNPIFITDYFILPPDDSTFPSTQSSFEVTATAIFTYNGVDYPLDVTTSSTYSSDTLSVIRMSGNIAYIEGVGSAVVTANYLAESAHATYNVQLVVWELGASELDTTTALG